MRAVVYTEVGPSSVLSLVERDLPEPGAGEVRVRVVRAGVNPTDVKWRGGAMGPVQGEVAPGQDGAGVVDAVGAGVDSVAVGDRVWLYLAQAGRPWGTAIEHTVQPVEHVVALPDGASFDLGAALGVPAITAHRALTSGESVSRLGPGALDGATVLVAGGAGAVGNAAIQLARWAGATVVATVSSEEKAALARAAGAQHVVDYRAEGPDGTIEAVRRVAPDGVDLVVEVAPAANLALDVAVVRNRGTVAFYANDGGADASFAVRGAFAKNLRLQGVFLYELGADLLGAAAQDVTAALRDGALGVGEGAGLPLHHFALEETAAAHDAVEGAVVGKVLVDVGSAE